jgi:hypothetical protein
MELSMKKILIATLFLLSANALTAASTIGRYEYTERLATCQKLKAISDGMSSDGVAASNASMSSFITNCLGTTFDDLNVVPIARQVFCQDEVRVIGACKFRLESSPVGSVVKAKTINSGFRGMAGFTCGGSGTWTNSGASNCIENASKCPQETVSWGSGTACLATVPELKEGASIRIKNNGKVNATVTGYATASCSGGVLSVSGGNCANHVCRTNQSFIWSNESVAVVTVAGAAPIAISGAGVQPEAISPASAVPVVVPTETVSANTALTTERVKNIPKCKGLVDSVDGITGIARYVKVDSRYFKTLLEAQQQSRVFEGEVNVVCNRGVWTATNGHCTRYSDTAPTGDLDCDVHKIKIGFEDQRDVFKCAKR